MSVKLQPRARTFARSLLLLSALTIACAPEDEDNGNGLGQTPGPIQGTPDASSALPDSGVPMQQPVLPDAGSPFVPPAVDSGGFVPPVVVDAGPAVVPDAGAIDAGPARSDAGSDAGATADAGGGCPTYDNFGRTFMMMYCASCHMGASAPKMIRLDTLAGVMAQKAMIQRVAVTGMAMPPSNPRPSAADRQKLGQWLTCGPN